MNNRKTYKLTKEMIPGQTFHPGVLLQDEIEYRGISQKELAVRMNIEPSVLSEIIHGKRNLTPDIAFKLEKALDIDAIIWMRLQVKFEIDGLRILERGRNKQIAIQNTNTGTLPYHASNSSSAHVREPKSIYSKSKTRKRD